MPPAAPASPHPDGPRAVFLDFDGTYADHGAVPPAHVAAVRAARAAGHRVLLCTGRPLAILADAVLAELDGAVTSSGARVDVGGATLEDHRIAPELAARAVDVLEHHGASYILEAPDAMHAPAGSLERLRRSVTAQLRRSEAGEENARRVLDAIRVPADLRDCSFAKISVWEAPVGIEQLAAEIGPGLRPLPNAVTGDAARSGELQDATRDKADGMARVLRHLGLPPAASIGVGDGMNDVGMLRAAGTAVGIEGAPRAVLEPADLVVPGPERHGVAEAFARLGLI